MAPYSTTYDVGPVAVCPYSVLDNALSEVVTIAGEMSTAPLKLSLSLMAGKFTPVSVLSLSGVTSIDLPQQQGMPMRTNNYTVCERLPLAWHTTSVGSAGPPVTPYVATAYETAYTNAQRALGQEIYRYSGLHGYVLNIKILKESGTTSNSLEFDVPARVGEIYTSPDPQMSSPPQGAPYIQCPDMTSAVTGAVALQNAYTATGNTQWFMTDAIEYTFGYFMGFDEGLASQSGPASGALLSIATKGVATFAQIDCGLEGNEMTCGPDPSPIADQYNWEDYYFFQFLKHLDLANTRAIVGAVAGYAQACTGATCSPSTLTTISPTQMSVVNTGLDTTSGDVSGSAVSPTGGYAEEPQCWLNNAPNNPYSLNLYSSMTGQPTAVYLRGDSVVLGWQTIPQQASTCALGQNNGYILMNGISNGGQYLEIETDSASEPLCDQPLNGPLTTLLTGNGNAQTTCAN